MKRPCLTVTDARLLAAECRHIRGEVQTGQPSRVAAACRVLDDTADALEGWANKVSMRRGDPQTPSKGVYGGAGDNPDPKWQSTDFARKLTEAVDKSQRSSGA